VADLCSLIEERGIPVTGFANPSVDARMPELLERWQAAGIELGNHTWSHPDLRKVGPEFFIEDLQRGHAAIRARAPDQPRIAFRYPYLSEGLDPVAREAVRDALAELGSPIAPVTIITQDWYYSTEYTLARIAGDPVAAERWVDPWRWDLEDATRSAEALSRKLFDREPPQILLLHANELNAGFLGEYLDWLERRGYRFVSLAEALADPAYREIDLTTWPDDDSLWRRLTRSRALAQGIGGLGRRIPPREPGETGAAP
jgi:peptidoglycan/xylan/chitin deacetylase (PgdA/CDA1 family)